MVRFERLVESYKDAQQKWVDAAQARGQLASDDPGLVALIDAEQKALITLGVAVNAAHSASADILGTLKTAKLAGEDGKPHGSFNAYLKMLVPTARQFTAKFKGEAEKIDFQINSLDDEEEDD
jgi:hypothetical protein